MLIIDWKWTKEGEEPITRQQGSDATLDWITKHMKGLTGKQVYDLKNKKSLEFVDERGWQVEIKISEMSKYEEYARRKSMELGNRESVSQQTQPNPS